MFARNASPIGNIPVYKPIGVNEPRPAEPARTPSSYEIVQKIAWEHEHRRIWNLVVQTATGTNAPAVTQGGYQAPSEDCA